jgi:hypothetical protein
MKIEIRKLNWVDTIYYNGEYWKEAKQKVEETLDVELIAYYEYLEGKIYLKEVNTK